MDANEVSKLVEVAERSVFKRLEEPLQDVEKSIIRQILEGKKLVDIEYSGYASGTIQRILFPKIREKLGRVAKKRVTIRTVQAVLEELQQQELYSDAAPQIQHPTEIQPELNNHLDVKDSVSCSELRDGEETAKVSNSVEPEQQPPTPVGLIYGINSRYSERQNFDQQNSKRGSPLDTLKVVFKFSAMILLGCIGGYVFIGSRIAPFVNELGRNSHKDRQLLMAQQYYRLAALLDPNYAQPRYNLAYLCDESLHDRKCAIQAHQAAALRGLSESYAELARLQIKDKNYEAALSAIWECLELTKIDKVKAACLKNRAWVRWEQKKRLDEAEYDLRRAIAIEDDSPHSYCLLAQVLEVKGRQQEALEAWRKTKHYATDHYNVPELDKCIEMAKQRLRTQGERL